MVRWKKYVKFEKVLKGLEETTQGQDDEDEGVELNNHQLTFKEVGPINSEEDLDPLLIEEQFLRGIKDPSNNFHLKTSAKEDEDFVLLPDAAFQLLKSNYGGRDVPRFSIEAEKEDEEQESMFIVEVYLKKLNIYILPKVKNHLVLKKPSGVFISRKGTIRDFKLKIARILFENK